MGHRWTTSILLQFGLGEEEGESSSVVDSRSPAGGKIETRNHSGRGTRRGDIWKNVPFCPHILAAMVPRGGKNVAVYEGPAAEGHSDSQIQDGPG